jgi:surface protein
LLLKAQSNQTNYQFWIDDSKDEAVYGTMNGEDINLSLDVGSLNPGVHFYNIRAYETVGNKVKWGSLFRYLFCIPQYTGEDTLDNLQGYEYWLDNDYEHRVITVASGDKNEALLSIDVSSLGSGLHFYNIRALETVGSKIEWGSQFRYLFCIPMDAKATPDNIQSYEYWLDNDYEHRISKQVSDDECVAQLSLDVSSFSPGVHFYNLRMKDTEGIWSASQRYMFSIPYPRQEVVDRLLITGYSYAFNDGTPTNVVFDSPVEEYQLVKSFSIPQGQPPMVIDDDCGFIFDEDENTATLSRNINMSFALFFKDQSDAMCSPATTDFVVQDVLSETIQLMACPGTASISSHANGGFSVVRFDVTNAMKLKLTADDSCCVRLYSPYSQLLDNYDASALLQGATREYEEGTYYAVVFDNSKEVKLSLGLADINALKPNISFDMDSYVVTISCKTAGPAIYYTLDGSIPTTESTPYIEPFVLDKNCTIKAIAAWSADKAGPVATLDIDIFDVANVTFAQKGSQLTLSTATEGATISYSVDGGDWATYSDVLVLEGSHTVQAYAEKQGYNQSIVSTYKFFYESPVVLIPQITYEGNVITITCETSDATVYYTIDGTVPTSESMVYTKPFTVSENCTIRAFAVKEGYVDSQIAMLEVVLNVGGYAIFNSSSGTLTFKYGPIPSGDNVFETENTEFSWNPSWDCSKLRTVIFDSSYAEARPTSTACWFNGAQNLTEIRNLKYLNTTSVTNMALMFQGCKKLSSIDVSHFDTESVTWIGCMFAECSTLTSVDVSNFNTSMVLSFNGMFAGCRKLATLDVSHFDTSNAYDMSFMFSECNSLLTIDVGNFNTSNVTNMKGMFLGCNSLQKLDVSHFDTRKVTSFGTGSDDKTNTIAGMFMDCFNLTCLDLSNFNTSNVAFMGQMFSRCSKLHTIYVGEEWTVENVTFSNDMFKDCTSLVGERGTCYNTSYTDISYARIDGGETAPGYLSEIGFVPTTCGYAMLDSSTGTLTFKYGVIPEGDNVWETENTDFCSKNPLNNGERENLPPWNNGSLKTVVFEPSYAEARPISTAFWFYEAKNLTEIDGIEYLNTSEVTDMHCMFYNCSSLKVLDVSHFNTQQVEHIECMFTGCSNVLKLDVSHFEIELVKDLQCMFQNCSKIKVLDLSSFDTKNIGGAGIAMLFSGCSSLTTIYVSDKWSTEHLAPANNAFPFYNCYSLVGGMGTTFNANWLNEIYARVDGGKDAPGYFTLKGDVEPTPDPTWSAYAVLSENNTVLTFYYDENKSSRNGMSIFNGQYVSWYSYCHLIKKVIFDDTFANYHPTSTFGWFCNCSVLKEVISIKNLKTDKVTNMRSMFSTCVSLERLDLSSFDTRNVTDMSCMFMDCSSLKYLDLSSFNTSKVTSMYSMFVNCNSLEGLDVSNFDTKNVSSMNYVFLGCAALRSLDISSFNTSKVTDMFQMFKNCKSLREIYVGDGWNTSRVTNSYEMLDNCLRLRGGNGTKFNSLITDGKYAHVDGKEGSPGYFTYKKANDVIGGYAQLDESTATLTFKYGCMPQSENVYDVSATHYDFENPAPWDNSRLKEIVIDPTFASAFPMSTAFWFCGASQIKGIKGIENLNSSNVRDMSYMFASCESMESVNLSNMETYRVSNMSNMFKDCKRITTIYVGDYWNTENVLNNEGIFEGCSSLIGYRGTSYNVSNIDKTYAVVDGGAECPGYLSPMPRGYALFDEATGTLTFKYGVMPKRAYYDATEKNYIYRADRIARGYTVSTYWHHNKIKNVVFEESFSAARPKSTAEWFFNNTTITSIVGLEYLNTSEVEDMGCMFYNCSGLKDLDVSHFNTSNVRSMDCLFYGCSNLTSLDVSKFKTDSVITTNAMFYNCKALTHLDVSHFATQNVDNMSFMFAYCSGLTSLDVSRFNTQNVTSMNTMFQMCTGLKTLDVRNFDTSKVTNMGYMFNVCSGLTNIGLRNFNTSKVTNIRCMFQSCTGLRSLDLSAFDTRNVTMTDSIFGNCQNLKTIWVGDNWKMDNVSSGRNMFLLCTSLVGGGGTKYNSSCVDKSYAHIDGGIANPGYFTDRNVIKLGDVNDNGVVDLVDAVAMVNYILGTPSSSFKTISADINDDGEIDVFDVTMLINMILADSDEPASSRRAYDDIQEREPILLTSYGNSVYMGIDYPERFTAFQFDVTISSGVDLSDVLMVSNDNNHSLTFTKIGEDKYTVIGISLNNDLLKSANGKLVEMILSDQLNGDVMVSNIHFVTPEEEEMYFCDGMLCVVTGIASNSEECEEIIYDLSGRKQTKSRGLLGRGVYVINGKKTVIK